MGRICSSVVSCVHYAKSKHFDLCIVPLVEAQSSVSFFTSLCHLSLYLLPSRLSSVPDLLWRHLKDSMNRRSNGNYSLRKSVRLVYISPFSVDASNTPNKCLFQTFNQAVRFMGPRAVCNNLMFKSEHHFFKTLDL